MGPEPRFINIGFQRFHRFFRPVLFPNRLPALLSALDPVAHSDFFLHALQLLLGIDQTRMRVSVILPFCTHRLPSFAGEPFVTTWRVYHISLSHIKLLNSCQ